MDYVGIAKEFLPLFISEEEMPKKDLEAIVEDAFRGKFTADDIAPLVQLKASMCFSVGFE